MTIAVKDPHHVLSPGALETGSATTAVPTISPHVTAASSAVMTGKMAEVVAAAVAVEVRCFLLPDVHHFRVYL